MYELIETFGLSSLRYTNLVKQRQGEKNKHGKQEIPSTATVVHGNVWMSQPLRADILDVELTLLLIVTQPAHASNTSAVQLWIFYNSSFFTRHGRGYMPCQITSNNGCI